MVSTSLFTGLSGLRTHQRSIDVIGNNVANVSTPGYWASRTTFGDILSFTMRSGSGPNGTFGGQNPIQVGLGTQIASIDVNTQQGTFQNTGRQLDVAIQGRGFFTLTDGSRSYYTRVGTFGVDSSRTLVDLRTGLRVQNSSGANVEIPLTDTLPPQATGEITFEGNLPAEVSGPLAEIIESSAPFLSGTSASQTASSGGATYDLSAYVNQTVLISVNGGAQQSVSVNASGWADPTGATATATEVAGLFSGINGLTAAVAGNSVQLDTVRLGTSATLKLDDGPGAAGLLTALGLNASLQTGTETAALASTDLASLTSRNLPYVNGDQITISGTNPDGSAVSDTFIYGAGNSGTSLGDMVNFINATYDSAQVTASLQANGAIRMTASQKQPASLSLVIADAQSNTGTSNFPSMSVLQDGEGPDTAITSIDVVDSLGRNHSVTMTFTRSANDPSTWDLAATMDPAEGVISSNTVSTIRFNQDGSFNVVGGGTSDLTFLFSGISAPQDVSVNLGTSGTFDGVSLVGDRTTVAATGQDGYVAGNLLNVAFEAAGNLQGFYSNGQTRTLDTLRITLVPNEAGLQRIGDTLFVESPNSGDAIATTATAAGAGVIRPGSLENSNVDIAEEFVKLITAQRGFQANSRVITTADEILAELVNIVR